MNGYIAVLTPLLIVTVMIQMFWGSEYKAFKIVEKEYAFENITKKASNQAILAFETCRTLCLVLKLKTPEWNNGLCIKRDTSGWSCDIAHCPRIHSVDDSKSFQCNSTRWIELDTDCSWLRYRSSLNESRKPMFCSADGSTYIGSTG